MENLKKYLEQDGKSENTIKNYIGQIEQYVNWFKGTYGEEFKKLYRGNVLEYKGRLKTVENNNPKTINAKLAALVKFNEFLIESGVQKDIVIGKKDYIKIQEQLASLTEINEKEVQAFRQRVLENEGKRNYAIVTILAYAGLRISECLNLKIQDVDLIGREIIVREGKGDKQRLVYINDKIINAIKEYLKECKSDSEHLFVSQKGNRLDRTVINRMFKKYSEKITPHSLRHFYCTIALEKGFSIHEVANQAGHSNIHTTLRYTNPSREVMKEKANRL